MEIDTKSVTPTIKRTAARNDRGCDLSSKARAYGIPIASPIMNTSVWSAIEPGEVRKKKASVTWKSEMDVMIVAPEMTAILVL